MPIAPETLLSGLATFLQVGGTLNSGNKTRDAADKTAAAYRAQADGAVLVADFNARQYEQRAAQLRTQRTQIAKAGAAEENASRLATAQLVGAQQAAYAAGNIVVNRGTPAAMQISAVRQGEVDALRIRDNTSNQIQSNAFEEQQALGQADLLRLEGEQARAAGYNMATLTEAEGENAEEGSWLDAVSGLITSPVASKWLTDLMTSGGAAGAGGVGAGGAGGAGGGAPPPTSTWSKFVPSVTELAAGIAGGYAGQYIGEKITGNEATANWGASVGGLAGSLFGPAGSAIGAAIGGFIDSAFGASYSHNAGFLIHDVPGAPADRKFNIEPFASGIQPVGFVRRQSKADAERVIEPFRVLDKGIVDLAAEFGYTITGEFVRGTDEKGDANNDGVFIGSASEGDKRGKTVAAHMNDYATGLLKSLEGQISDEGYAAIQGAGSTENKLIKMREVLAQESNTNG